MRVLVTGGAGYVGSILVRVLLSKGYEVLCVDKLDFGGDSIVDLLRYPKFEFLNLNLLHAEEVREKLDDKEFHAVLHLAAIVGDPACKIDAELSRRTNLEASSQLLDIAVAKNVDKFVFASTCSNYGKMDEAGGFVTEDSPLAPVSLYAELKVEFEKKLLEVSNSGVDTCLTALRFATVYGLSPRMRFDLTVNEFTKEMAMGRTLTIFGEQFWRPYCHVADFSQAFLRVLEAPKSAVDKQVFNVGSTDENYTKRMLADELMNVFPQGKIEYVVKNEDPRDYRVNCDKIGSVLGFEPTMVVLDGIREIADALKLKVISNPDQQRYFNIPV
tara:strand:- start:23362 stop:24348 length:987 start_codon:yes stop_codon:yes gene_type:complete